MRKAAVVEQLNSVFLFTRWFKAQKAATKTIVACDPDRIVF
jgi:hypothetical protein